MNDETRARNIGSRDDRFGTQTDILMPYGDFTEFHPHSPSIIAPISLGIDRKIKRCEKRNLRIPARLVHFTADAVAQSITLRDIIFFTNVISASPPGNENFVYTRNLKLIM